MTFPFPHFSPGVTHAAVTLAFTDSFKDFGGNPMSFATKSLGSTATDRVTLIGAAWSNFSSNRTLDAVTVGGNSATRIARGVDAANKTNAELWGIVSGTGSPLAANTTATIAFTFDTTSQSLMATLYSLTGNSSSLTPTATNQGPNPDTDVSVPILTGGAAIVVAVNFSVSAASMSNITEDYNTVETIANTTRGIHGHSTTAGTLTSTLSISGTQQTLLAVAF